MKDRIRFISHKGKKILLADASNGSAEGFGATIPIGSVEDHSAGTSRVSSLLLADFSRLEG